MKRHELKKLANELDDFLDSMVDGLGRTESREAMKLYSVGLLLDGERKSVEPIAARLVHDESETEAMRQRLQQAVTVSPWADETILQRLAMKLDQELPGVEALVIDDTGFPKKGEHSVGVARQYSGTLGRVDNCQVAVSLHLASEAGSGCVGMQLYLTEAWAADAKRRKKAGVPEDVAFKRKWEIALDLLDRALAWGVRRQLVLADAGYGDCGEFRAALEDRGLQYIVGIQTTITILDGDQAVKVSDYAKNAGRCAFRRLTWRHGSKGTQASNFFVSRVHLANGRGRRTGPDAERWLICEWPTDEANPTKYWLSNLPANAMPNGLVRRAKLRWRVERDYQEMKGELGLDHFEGRTWRGFHHHVTLCSLAHGFLALRRALSPPEQDEMEHGDRAPRASAGAPAEDRRVPAVSKALRSPRSTTRSIADVIR